MTQYLLDVNVLIALLWPSHRDHGKTQAWFSRKASRRWATCAITQAGFVRIVSNPSFSALAVLPKDALAVLKANLEHPGHCFWELMTPLPELTEPVMKQATGHRHVTDAILLSLAIEHEGKLATLDHKILSLTLGGATWKNHLETIL